VITEIGIAAGEVWHYLEEHRKSSLPDILKGIDKPQDIALMSIGWLAREGHVIVEKEGKEYKVQLREQ